MIKVRNISTRIIEWAHTQNIKGDFVDKSIDKFMEMMYLKGKDT